MPAVSIVMPVRNAAGTIAASLASIRAQSFRDWELVAVDDGSTDETPALIGHAARRDRRIHLIERPFSGIARSLQAGLQESRGPYIARMDADDVSHPERLERQIGFLRAHPDIGLVGSLVRFGGDRRRGRGYALHVDWLNSVVTQEDIALNRFIEAPFAHPSVVFRQDLTARFGGYRNGPFPEDFELWLRWFDAGVLMAKVPDCLLEWNDPPTRLSRTDPRYGFDAFYRVKALYLARELEKTRRGREVWIWGAGRTTRKRAELLTRRGIEIRGYIDVDPRKCGKIVHGRPVVDPDGMPGAESAIVLGYVGKRGARAFIRAELRSRGFREGGDFWMGA